MNACDAPSRQRTLLLIRSGLFRKGGVPITCRIRAVSECKTNTGCLLFTFPNKYMSNVHQEKEFSLIEKLQITDYQLIGCMKCNFTGVALKMVVDMAHFECMYSLKLGCSGWIE